MHNDLIHMLMSSGILRRVDWYSYCYVRGQWCLQLEDQAVHSSWTI